MTARSGGGRSLAVSIVALQTALLVAFFLAPRRNDWPVPAWLAAVGSTAVVAGAAILVLAALNLGRALTPLPTPAPRGALRTGGLYRFVRHPIYSGLLLLLFGSAAGSGSVVRLALAGALLGLLTRKARWEEDMLRRRYPGYDDYARRTPGSSPDPIGDRRDREEVAAEIADLVARSGLTPPR